MSCNMKQVLNSYFIQTQAMVILVKNRKVNFMNHPPGHHNSASQFPIIDRLNQWLAYSITGVSQGIHFCGHLFVE